MFGMGGFAPQTPQGFAHGPKAKRGGEEGEAAEETASVPSLLDLDGARGAPQRCPILRPGSVTIAQISRIRQKKHGDASGVS